MQVTENQITSREAETKALTVVVHKAATLLNADRATIFLHLEDENTLYSRVLVGDDVQEIRIPCDEGIAGKVFGSGLCRIENDLQHSSHLKRVDRETEYVTKSMICAPLINDSGSPIGVLQILNKLEGAFTEKDIPVLQALALQTVVILENAQLADRLANEKTQSEKLGHELVKLNKDLQDAYRELERNKTLTERKLQKGNRLWKNIMVALGLLIILIVVFVVRGSFKDDISSGPSYSFDQEVQTIQAIEQPLSRTLSIRGLLAPLRMANVVAPFSGRIEQCHVQFGDSIKKGQVLLNINPGELKAQQRNARISEMRARAEVDRLQTWEQSAEVIGARRNVIETERTLGLARKRFNSNQSLYAKGLISLVALEESEGMFESSKASYSSSTNQFVAIMARAQGEHLEAVELQYQNALDQLNSIEEMISMAELKSPVDGILLTPPRLGGDGNPVVLEVGSTLQQGALIFAVGNLSGFTVSSQVDELDIAQIKVGQPVEAYCDAFPDISLQGSVQSVSSQALADDSGLPSFNMEIVIPSLPNATEGRLQLGMSVNCSVITYENPNAVLVPVRMVQSEFNEMSGEDEHFVWVLIDEQVRKSTVRTGWSNLSQVEILEGIQAGDTLVTTPPVLP